MQRRDAMEIFKGKENISISKKKKYFFNSRQYSDGDDDDENDSPLSDNGRSQPSPRSYNYYQ
jgi:hypothetical protein